MTKGKSRRQNVKTPGKNKKGRRTRNKNNKNKNTPAFSPVSPTFSYPDTETALFDFRRITADLKYEICATIEIVSDEEVRLLLHNKGHRSNTTSRDSCTFDKNKSQNIILHNHPDKYYPSREDIEKVVKDKNMTIEESYIFCKFGIWSIAVTAENKISKHEVEEKAHYATEAFTAFYHATGKGRVYNKTAIDVLCQKIGKLYSIDIQFLHLE
jgi:hypothetical protein